MSQGESNVDELIGKYVGDSQYRFKSVLGQGAFGRVYVGEDMSATGSGQNTLVVIKTEMINAELPQLMLEFKFYNRLGSYTTAEPFRHLPKIMTEVKRCGAWHGLVMEMLGPSLSKMFETCNFRFTAQCTAKLAIQLLRIFAYVHGMHVLHRDIKPDNFLLGLPNTDKWCTVHVVDFGLSKLWKDMSKSDDGRHIPFATREIQLGTMRYISLNNHRGLELSRVSDLEAIGYMLVHFARGNLPWQGITAPEPQRSELIWKKKEETTLDEMCAGLPAAFAQYLRTVYGYKFAQDPDYDALSQLFVAYLKRCHVNANDERHYDWDRRHQPVRNNRNKPKSRFKP